VILGTYEGNYFLFSSDNNAWNLYRLTHGDIKIGPKTAVLSRFIQIAPEMEF
jgi:hypothetical protein